MSPVAGTGIVACFSRLEGRQAPRSGFLKSSKSSSSHSGQYFLNSWYTEKFEKHKMTMKIINLKENDNLKITKAIEIAAKTTCRNIMVK